MFNNFQEIVKYEMGFNPLNQVYRLNHDEEPEER